MSSFEIKVNKRAYTLWESATYSRSIDNLCGAFSFTSSDKIPDDYPVKKGDSVQIFLNGEAVLTGFVDTIGNTGSTKGSNITVSGRDKTSDIVDSSVPEGAKNSEGKKSLKSLCELVISGFGATIKVIDASGGIDDFTEDELQAGASSENAFDYLNNFARKRQVYLITNGNGDLVIFRPGVNKASTVLRNEKNNPNNNVKTWDSQNSDSARYNKYVARSQDNVGSDPLADYWGEGSSREGTATDDQIRNSRYLEIICEETMTDQEANNRATEESNLRRARGFSYTATLAEITQANGDLWGIGQLIEVSDFKCRISGRFLSRSVELSQGLDGSSTTLVMADPDAYTLNASLSKTDARKTKINEGFVL